MNVDIKNFKGEVNGKEVKYRITSHGGRAFDLYNRTTNKVIGIRPEDFYSIVNSKASFEMCVIVEKEFFK